MSDLHSTSTLQPSASASNPITTMPSPIRPTSLPLTLILAATPKMGIGNRGQLPWPQLKTEMGYFARVTKRILPVRVSESLSSLERKRVNAVVMGRKTWDSIPERFRPLKGRLNVVITRDAGAERWQGVGAEGREKGESVEGPLVAGSLEDALERIERHHGRTASVAPEADAQEETESLPKMTIQPDVEIARVFVIGGASIYAEALALSQTSRVLLTKIQEEYECDTVFPVDLDGEEGRRMGWRLRGKEELEGFVGEEVPGQVEEKGVRFEFCLYERERERQV